MTGTITGRDAAAESPKIQAIETTYKGYRFRSRLEARWAVFLDSLGVEWGYETQGYKMSDGSRYLPDFHLPEYSWMVEVKGTDEALCADEMKIRAFSRESGYPVLILGEIPPPMYVLSIPSHGVIVGDETTVAVVIDGRHSIFGRPDGALAKVPNEGGKAGFLRSAVSPAGWKLSTKGTCVLGLMPSPDITLAYDAARQARFEHGEHGTRH